MIRIESPRGTLEESDRREALRQVRHMLRLDEPLEEFHALCRRIPGYRWVPRRGAGRLLRAPDPFEDLVKLVCTTNCSWSLTRVMIGALVEGLGEPITSATSHGAGEPSDVHAGTTEERRGNVPLSPRSDEREAAEVNAAASRARSTTEVRGSGASPATAAAVSGRELRRTRPKSRRLGETAVLRAFPTPEAMAEAPPSFYRDTMRAGYRAPHLHDLARRVVAGDVDPSSWLDPARDAGEIQKEIRSVRGAGPYVAENMMKLLGRYGGLGLDSWCRRKFTEIHARGRKASDRTIERHYARFASWRGLALWCDLTRDWLDAGPAAPDILASQKY